jgi:CHASE1-domain containing sensor protein
LSYLGQPLKLFVDSLEAETLIQALEWIPRVPNADRLQFERAAIADGLLGFQFTERAVQGLMMRAEERDAYFPVYFVEPLEGNQKALGFDLGSNATRLAALNDAGLSGKEVASARITLVQETGEQYGFLIFIPIY